MSMLSERMCSDRARESSKMLRPLIGPKGASEGRGKPRKGAGREPIYWLSKMRPKQPTQYLRRAETLRPAVKHSALDNVVLLPANSGLAWIGYIRYHLAGTGMATKPIYLLDYSINQLIVERKRQSKFKQHRYKPAWKVPSNEQRYEKKGEGKGSGDWGKCQV
ncbi:hypothetical protein CPB83DRAFT_841169 [Crepidotus variabilis]|uniref:Uncharacterized protein n=1 Tax=Crepidotus variabilis TaxID=179855 RepID=A0A9P6E2Z4_9AGAR|nr:hypothetical protein CPB83DRAFT_841169 [Crepidotus variabilis]